MPFIASQFSSDPDVWPEEAQLWSGVLRATRALVPYSPVCSVCFFAALLCSLARGHLGPELWGLMALCNTVVQHLAGAWLCSLPPLGSRPILSPQCLRASVWTHSPNRPWWQCSGVPATHGGGVYQLLGYQPESKQYTGLVAGGQTPRREGLLTHLGLVREASASIMTWGHHLLLPLPVRTLCAMSFSNFD